MKKFLLKLVFTGLATYFTLLGFQTVIDYFLSKENSMNNNLWHKIYNGKLKTDIVILGTSRAQSHYDPQIIEKITGLKTYNLGLSGTHYNILKIRWKSFINHNSNPKILILDLDNGGLQLSENIYDKFQYLPYSSNDEYKTVAEKIDDDYYYERLIPLYKYRGFEMNIFKQIKSLKDKSSCSKNFNGYVEHDIDWISKDYLSFKQKLENDNSNTNINIQAYSEGLSVLREIITDCKKHNIKIYFVWSPLYYEGQNYFRFDKDFINQKLLSFSKFHNIKYQNYLNDSLCLDRKYFYNSQHMNKKGVSIFSKKIAEMIRKDL